CAEFDPGGERKGQIQGDREGRRGASHEHADGERDSDAPGCDRHRRRGGGLRPDDARLLRVHLRGQAGGAEGVMPNGRALLVTVAMLLAGTASAGAQAAPDRKDWVQLFNGRDLEGWYVNITGHDLNDNFGNTFRVENGLLKVRYDGYNTFDGRFGHIFYRESFSDYIVAVEYRFRSEEHTSELQSRGHLVCRLLLEKKKHLLRPYSTS